MSSSTENNSQACCEHDRIMDILRSIPHFSEMQVDPLRILALMCNHMNYQPGTIVFHAGDSDDKAYYIVEGSAEVIRETNGDQVVVGTLEQGAFVGALALLSDVKRLFSLRAQTPLKCLVIPRSKLRQAFEKPGDGREKFIKSIVESVIAWEDARLRSDTNCVDSLGSVGVSLL